MFCCRRWWCFQILSGGQIVFPFPIPPREKLQEGSNLWSNPARILALSRVGCCAAASCSFWDASAQSPWTIHSDLHIEIFNHLKNEYRMKHDACSSRISGIISGELGRKKRTENRSHNCHRKERRAAAARSWEIFVGKLTSHCRMWRASFVWPAGWCWEYAYLSILSILSIVCVCAISVIEPTTLGD